jgi:hypothetical protein
VIFEQAGRPLLDVQKETRTLLSMTRLLINKVVMSES